MTIRPKIDTALEDLENLIATYEEGQGLAGEEALQLLKSTEEWSAAEG